MANQLINLSKYDNIIHYITSSPYGSHYNSVSWSKNAKKCVSITHKIVSWIK